MIDLSFPRLLRHLMSRYTFSFLSDSAYVQLLYRLRFDKPLHLGNPQSFNEKLQWLKLFDHDPRYTLFVDKYAVRDYVRKEIGDKYLVPLLGVWDSINDIDVSTFPNQFVIKTTHDSGGCVVCRQKSDWNISTQKKIAKSMRRNYYWYGREWPYKNVPHRIIAEQFLSDGGNGLTDYKIMCFNGSVKCILVCTDRLSGHGLKKTFYSPEWKRLPFKRPGPDSPIEIPPPIHLSEMIRIAEHLSGGIPFIRVDLYEAGDAIYFGELTLYPSSGAEAFYPQSWDRVLGDWITLPFSSV